MLRTWGTLVLFLLATPVLALAQNTGKLAGVVTDAETGEVLPGANVVLEGTNYGTATNLEGQYTIFEIPPGVYTIRASFVGFVSEVRSNLEIIAGITTQADFSLSPATGEIEEIQVVAERPLVNPTATSAIRRLSREEFASLPTRSVTSYYAMQPGVTFLNDEVYIRGGRPDETNYMLEGISSRSLYGADNVMPVIPEALEEIQVFAGGYSAELGGANAGIIQQVLRTGGSELEHLVQYETDQAANALGETSYEYSDLTVTTGGPLLATQHRFFLALNYQTTNNHRPEFWYGANLGLPVDDITGEVPADTLAWSSGTLPGIGRPLDALRVNGTLLFNFHPLRLRFGVAQLTGERRINEIPILDIYNQERLAKRDDVRRLANLQADYFLSNTTYLQASGGFFQYDFDIYDPLFSMPEADGDGGALLTLADYYSREALADRLSGNPELADRYTSGFRGTYTPPAPYVFNGFEFAHPGEPMFEQFERREQSYFNTALSLHSQIDNHELVIGGDWQRWTFRRYSARGAPVASRIQNDPTYVDSIRAETPDVAAVMRRAGYGGIGYDEFMNEVDSGPDGPKHPVLASVYVNDKMEFNDIIVNAGLRWDYFDMDLWTVDDLENPGYNSAEWQVEGLKNAPAKSVLQPRLGLSFPVTDRTVFHLQYGKFAQMPDMLYVYRSRAYLGLVFGGQNFIPNPFAFDLDPIKSTQYEIGFGHQFTNASAFDITAFYRKTEGQLEIVRQSTVPTSDAADYNVYRNGDFSIARGLEFSLRTRRIGNFLGMINYTLTDAKGTNSEPGGQVSALENGTAPPSLIQPLAFEQRHRGAFVVDYQTGPEPGPAWENWTASLLLSFNSGSRFTHSTGGIGQRGAGEGALLDDDPRGRIPLEPIGSSVTPWYFNTDLRVEKGFTMGFATATAYMYVQNLFDTKNTVNVYTRTGTAENDGFLSDPELSRQIIEARGQDYVDFYQAINVANRQHYMNDFSRDLFATPRQIRVGIRLEL